MLAVPKSIPISRENLNRLKNTDFYSFRRIIIGLSGTLKTSREVSGTASRVDCQDCSII